MLYYAKIKSASQNLSVQLTLIVVRVTGLDSRANCALGLPRSRTSPGSPLCADSPSSPVNFTKQNDRATRTLSHHLVRVTGLEPARGNHQILSLARLPIPPHPRDY